MSLDVHLSGELIGTLFPAGEHDYRFAYKPEVVEAKGAGTPLLSTSLPMRAEPFSSEASRAYVEALLPEGRTRSRLARVLELDPADGYGLISALGGDCAGAAVLVPEGGGIGDEGEPSWLDDGELEALVAGPGAGGEGPSPGFTLPGPRHKLALVREREGGRWALPTPATPSTHIVKPETGEFPELVRNEMFCMEVARSAGLPVAACELAEVGGRICLVSERFDRDGGGRLHQEDFCQALGFPPAGEEADEEDAEGPGFGEASGLLRAVGRPQDITPLFAVGFFNYAMGNGDAHGRNFALLHGGGPTRLAPFYDLSSTVVYDMPTHHGMVISEDYDQTAYLLEMGWISEESDFDFDEMRALASLTALRIRDGLESVCLRAREEGWHAPVIDEIVDLATERATGLGFEVEY